MLVNAQRIDSDVRRMYEAANQSPVYLNPEDYEETIVSATNRVTARDVLIEGSVVIETGGFKGRSREVEKSELYALFAQRLGADPTRCFSEYGMSELASQFYSQGVDGPKLAPPWLRTRILDPVTGTDAAPGKPGLLAHYDLANYNSVQAIQTEDMGIWDERGGFQLLGRAPGAVLRGCSLLAE